MRKFVLKAGVNQEQTANIRAFDETGFRDWFSSSSVERDDVRQFDAEQIITDHFALQSNNRRMRLKYDDDVNCFTSGVDKQHACFCL